MSEGWPDFWLKGKYIELIDTINTVNLIKQINTIDTVTNLGTLDTLNTIGTIQKINPQTIDATEYNTVIDLIKQITKIDEITKINPQTIDSEEYNTVIDLIKKINTIDTITNLGTLDTINTINTLGTVNIVEILKAIESFVWNADAPIPNRDFECGLLGWKGAPEGDYSVDSTKSYFGKYSVKLEPGAYIWTKPRGLRTDALTFLNLKVNGTSGDKVIVTVEYGYGDLDTTEYTIDTTGAWETVDITFRKQRIIRQITITAKLTNSAAINVDYLNYEILDYSPVKRLQPIVELETLCFTERWEQGFRKEYYIGRTGAYYKSEYNRAYDDWTPPEIIEEDNPIEPSPWNNALRLRNSKDGTTVDPIYVGLKKPVERGCLSFEAKLPSTGNAIHIGFEVNSGGAYSHIACLMIESDTWYLHAISRSGVRNSTVTLNNPDTYARYCLVYNPPTLELWQAPSGVPDGFPLERTNTLDIGDVEGWAIPFFASEDESAIYEARIGNFWVWQIPRPKYPVDWENMPKDRTITDITKTVTPVEFNVSATGSGNTSIYTPPSGKAIRVKLIQYESDADVEVGFRFGTSGYLWARRVTKGVLAINFIGCNPQGAVDEVLYCYTGGAVNVKGFVLLEAV